MGSGLCCVVCFWVMLLAGIAVLLAFVFLEAKKDPTSPVRVFVSDMSLSSFEMTPSSRQLNGTWHIDFSLLYKSMIGESFPCDSAAVLVYYKGTYLAGVNLHAFLVPGKHPIPLEANVDASRSDVPGWLAHYLAEARTLGVVEFEVQFVAKYDIWHITYLCRGLRLGFSTVEEAKLIGDDRVRCPFIG